jgi:hypothetical protein
VHNAETGLAGRSQRYSKIAVQRQAFDRPGAAVEIACVEIEQFNFSAPRRPPLDRRRSLSQIETAIPGCFVLLYLAMLIAAIVMRGT